VTGTESEAAAYEFTTLTCIPGVIHYKGTKIQLLDLPGIIEGAASGKGRGRYFSRTLFAPPSNEHLQNHAQQFHEPETLDVTLAHM
jgi:GTPase involved in cell partitioning and DNA repair